MKNFLRIIRLLFIGSITMFGINSCDDDKVNNLINKLSITNEDLTVSLGGTLQLETDYTPKDVKNLKLFWDSSNEEIATVEQDGLVTGLKEGKADISVACGDLKCTVTVNVDASYIEVEKIIAPKSLKIQLGKEKNIGAKVLPNNASNKTLVYTSSDDKIATVNEKGVIKALAIGSTDIEIKSHNKKIVTCKIIVSKDPVHDEDFYIIPEELSVVLGRLQGTIEAFVNPELGKNEKITWEVENSSIIGVDTSKVGRTKFIVDPRAIGETNITFTCRGKTANCKVTVTEDFVPLQEIKFVDMDAVMQKGTKQEIKYELVPENATYRNIAFTLNLGFDDVARIEYIDNKPYICAVGLGQVTLRAQNESFEGYSEFVITVDGDPDPIENPIIMSPRATVSPRSEAWYLCPSILVENGDWDSDYGDGVDYMEFDAKLIQDGNYITWGDDDPLNDFQPTNGRGEYYIKCSDDCPDGYKATLVVTRISDGSEARCKITANMKGFQYYMPMKSYMPRQHMWLKPSEKRHFLDPDGTGIPGDYMSMEPEDASDKTISMIIYDESIAEFDEETQMFFGKKPGKTRAISFSNDCGQGWYIEITVSEDIF